MNYNKNMDNDISLFNKILLYSLVISFAVFVGTGIFLLMNSKRTVADKNEAIPVVVTTPTPTPVRVTRGLINLKNNTPVNKLNNPVDLNLMADSNGENVTAFDSVISYDPTSFDFIRADSIDPNFKVYSYKKDKLLILTVIKTGQNNVKTIFKGEALVKLAFQPKVKGNFTFSVMSSSGKETTKFVNEKTEIIDPSVNEIKVAIN